MFFNWLGCRMIYMVALSVVDPGITPFWVKSKTEIGVCFVFSKHAALRSKNKVWLVQNQDNVLIELFTVMEIHEVY